MFEKLIEFDTSLFLLLNNILANPLFDFIMPLFHNTKNWIPIILLLWIYLSYSNKKYRLQLLILTPLIILLCDQIGGFIKDFHLRSRPWVDIDSTQIRHLVDKKGALLSFPSNHAVNITGIAYFFSKIMKNHTMYFWASAVIIMFSRIYIGVHYPIDIIAGFLLGLLISKLIILSWNHLLDEEYKI